MGSITLGWMGAAALLLTCVPNAWPTTPLNFAPPAVFVRITLLNTSSLDGSPLRAANVGLSVFRYMTMDDNCGTIAINRNGSIADFGRGPTAVVDWQALDPTQALRVGQASAWADVSAALAPDLRLVNGEVPGGPPIPDPVDYRRMLTVTFNSPALPAPMPAARFDGNTGATGAVFELASAPSVDAIVWSTTVYSDRGIATFTVFGNHSITAPDTEILTIAEYAQRCEGLLQSHFDAGRAATSRNIDMVGPAEYYRRYPRKIVTAAMARDRAWPTDPYGVFDGNSTFAVARFLRAAGINRVGGLHSFRPGDVVGVSGSFGQFEAIYPWTSWLELDPFNATGFLAALQSRLMPFRTQLEAENGFNHERGDDLLVEGMDEPASFTVAQLANLTGGVSDFRRYLAEAEPGWAPETIASAMPVDISAVQPGNATSSSLYVHSCRWRQAATLDMHAHWRLAAQQVFGSGVRLAMDPPNVGSVSGLSFFELSRRGIVDVMLPEASSGGYIPPTYHGFYADIVRSAAIFGSAKVGTLWMVGRIGTPRGIRLSGMTWLMRQTSCLYLYLFGPWWEWAFAPVPETRGAVEEGWEVTSANTSKHMCSSGSRRCINNTANSFAVADVLQAAALVEDWTQEGSVEAVPAYVAMIYSSYSEVWEPHIDPANLAFGDLVYRASEGLWTEKQMLHVALSSYLQLPVDILTDIQVANASMLARYKLIYAVDPHLSTTAAAVLRKWVQQGGTLWTQARSLTRNELNMTSDLVASLHGGEASIRLDAGPPEQYQEIGFAGEAVVDLPELDTVHVADIPSDSVVVPSHGPRRALNYSFAAVACLETLSNFERARVVARFARDNGPALISFRAGAGSVWRLATVLGAPMARTAEPPFETRPNGWLPSHVFGAWFAQLYALPLAAAKIQRPVEIRNDHGIGVDARLFRNASGAALLLADYGDEGLREIDVVVDVSFRVAVTLEGQALKVSPARNGAATLVHDVPLKDIQAIFFSASR